MMPGSVTNFFFYLYGSPSVVVPMNMDSDLTYSNSAAFAKPADNFAFFHDFAPVEM